MDAHALPPGPTRSRAEVQRRAQRLDPQGSEGPQIVRRVALAGPGQPGHLGEELHAGPPNQSGPGPAPEPRVFTPHGVASNGVGASEFGLPIPNQPALGGGRVCAQYFWVGPTAPAPCPPLGLSATRSIEITVQP